MIRALWQGGSRATAAALHGRERPRLRPARRPPPVLVSGFGPKAVALAAEIGDGFVTTSRTRTRSALPLGGGRGPVTPARKVCSWLRRGGGARDRAPPVAERGAARRARAGPADALALRAGVELVTPGPALAADGPGPRRPRRDAAGVPDAGVENCSCSQIGPGRTRCSHLARRSCRGSADLVDQRRRVDRFVDQVSASRTWAPAAWAAAVLGGRERDDLVAVDASPTRRAEVDPRPRGRSRPPCAGGPPRAARRRGPPPRRRPAASTPGRGGHRRGAPAPRQQHGVLGDAGVAALGLDEARKRSSAAPSASASRGRSRPARRPPRRPSARPCGRRARRTDR